MVGIVFIRWDERSGAESLCSIPASSVLDSKTLMQLYSVHQYSGKQGFTSLNQKDITYASYYSGQEDNLFLILLLSNLDDADEYESILSDSMNDILLIKGLDEKIKKIPEIYQEISNFKNLTLEQKIGRILFDPITYATISRLRKEIVIEESDLELWLKDLYPMYRIDLEKMAQNLQTNGLIKINSFKGLAGKYWFLIKDILLMRSPAANLLKNITPDTLSGDLKDKYISQVQRFFSSIILDEKECIQSVQRIFRSAENYTFFTLLRQRVIHQIELEKMEMNFLVVDTKEIITELTRLNVITTLKDENQSDIYLLLSDFKVRLYFPLHNLNLILQMHKKNLQDPKILLQALEYLKEEYYAIFKSTKKSQSANATINDNISQIESSYDENLVKIEQLIKQESI